MHDILFELNTLVVHELVIIMCHLGPHTLKKDFLTTKFVYGALRVHYLIHMSAHIAYVAWPTWTLKCESTCQWHVLFSPCTLLLCVAGGKFCCPKPPDYWSRRPLRWSPLSLRLLMGALATNSAGTAAVIWLLLLSPEYLLGLPSRSRLGGCEGGFCRHVPICQW